MSAREWWDNLVPSVRGVVELANQDPHTVQIIAAALLPEQAAHMVADMGVQLRWIERLESDSSSDTLNDYYNERATWIYADRACDELAGELKSEVRLAAELVASLHAARKAEAA